MKTQSFKKECEASKSSVRRGMISEQVNVLDRECLEWKAKEWLSIESESGGEDKSGRRGFDCSNTQNAIVSCETLEGGEEAAFDRAGDPVSGRRAANSFVHVFVEKWKTPRGRREGPLLVCSTR